MTTINPTRTNGFAVSRELTAQRVPMTSLTPFGRQTRKHPPEQVNKIACNLEEFGFVLPILIDAVGRVVAGWALVMAARKLGLTEVPAVTIADFSGAKLRALRLALNRLSEDSKWDEDELVLEFSEILELEPDIDLAISGFEMGEIDTILAGDPSGEEDELPFIDEHADPVSTPGDMWHLGEHRILCGDSLQLETFKRLLGDERPRRSLETRPTTSRLLGTSRGWVGSSTKNSRWRPARCHRRNSSHF